MKTWMLCSRRLVVMGMVAAILSGGFWDRAAGFQTQPQPPTVRNLPVCPRPGDRCDSPSKSFAPFELPFRLPAHLKANGLYESSPFYAVVLRRQRDPPCDGGEYSRDLERFRRATQNRFPDRKVFADHQCPDMSTVSYSFLEEDHNENSSGAFVAVYAGETSAEGKVVVSSARREFPRATLHRMRVSFSRIVQ